MNISRIFTTSLERSNANLVTKLQETNATTARIAELETQLLELKNRQSHQEQELRIINEKHNRDTHSLMVITGDSMALKCVESGLYLNINTEAGRRNVQGTKHLKMDRECFTRLQIQEKKGKNIFSFADEEKRFALDYAHQRKNFSTCLYNINGNTNQLWIAEATTNGIFLKSQKTFDSHLVYLVGDQEVPRCISELEITEEQKKFAVWSME